ncbi:prenyltransferase/squalene oxidase repeat-containing protein [Conexibacter sp. JD483]|uniref:prenyltransferase/squalene oxidase repeat-containing protein n=1 Tax=unclassified Conexibacter TaxID=2627773 RepID=UPI0027225FE0|nr:MULTISPECIES: prenyltransferase/squalene oxidase repeat-containing protein [unclassified Conexibacter]MDO8184706.1 prenyltransferase/squalene oxidase repeat-containing protein [Conexibacter sp. CPCC 205706]MDO8198012.1 prenyltransferase/squalene oxidase repeat-containing protein [Conexibacter sp. CPCC 205762]MDR9368442.1 prenyltransferase/squalene oxidase repeat-containing protein [Conexibacter sp. JD483]
MSWQLASFGLLALALLAGFVWYERSHPSARVLALVGTLAALAVLGRIAFAAVPNVKPTTDIVLSAGYVFGGAPGFAVGAVAALASNFFFTQGPWTPWQMAAWGGVGVVGATLAKLSRGRLGRIPLAVACGLCGLAFGVVVNFGSVVTVSDEDLWGRFLAYQSTSLPWDLAHAAGNVVFFLLFGPALIRILRRFRTRFEFSWSTGPPAGPAPAPPAARGGLAALLLGAVALAGFAAAPVLPQARAAATTPVGYLLAAQNRDGGFGGAPGQRSVDLFSGWAALGLAAQGRNPADVRRHGGRTLLDYTRAHASGLGGEDPSSVGDLERTIMVVAAAGQDPRAFAGQDLVQALRSQVTSSGVLEQSNLTAFAILALRAARVPRADPDIARAAGWLASQQNRDGGWSFATRGGGSDVDDTAAAVQALIAAGRRAAPQTARALVFLRRQQNPDGGFPLLPDSGSNAQSTGWALQAFAAAGTRPSSVRRRPGGRSALAYLRSLVAPSGAVQFSRTSRQTPVWTTGTALVALAGSSFPLPPAQRTRSRATAPTAPASKSSAHAPTDDGGGFPTAAVIVPLAVVAGLAGGVGALRARRR